MEKIGPVLAARKDRFVLVSMAAALTIPDLRERGCGDWPLIRIMPNTPSAIREGVIFYTCDGVTAEEEAAFLENMAGAGAAAAPGRPSDGRRAAPWPAADRPLWTSSSRPWRTTAWPAASPVPWRWSAPPKR